MEKINLIIINYRKEFKKTIDFLKKEFNINIVSMNESSLEKFSNFKDIMNINNIDGIIIESNFENLNKMLKFADKCFLDVFKINSFENIENDLLFKELFLEFLQGINEDLEYLKNI